MQTTMPLLLPSLPSLLVLLQLPDEYEVDEGQGKKTQGWEAGQDVEMQQE